MKNATQYAKKVRKLLKGARKAPAAGAAEQDVLAVLVRSVLEADATAAQAARAFRVLEKEFVDFNEMRVSMSREITEYLGKVHPFAHRKAETITRVLNGIFYRGNDLSTKYMCDMLKRELRRHLSELGMGAYEASCLVLKCFGGHAVPVDQSLVECLEMNGLVSPGSELSDVQGFLERIIAQKNALTAHRFFRRYFQKHAKALARKRKAEAEAAARAARKAEEEAKKKAEAEARKKAEAEAGKRAAARRKARKKARKKAKKTVKRPKGTRKPAKKTGTKAARKAAKKPVKRPKGTRKPAKKTGTKAARKAAKKAGKAPAKTSRPRTKSGATRSAAKKRKATSPGRTRSRRAAATTKRAAKRARKT